MGAVCLGFQCKYAILRIALWIPPHTADTFSSLPFTTLNSLLPGCWALMPGEVLWCLALPEPQADHQPWKVKPGCWEVANSWQFGDSGEMKTPFHLIISHLEGFIPKQSWGLQSLQSCMGSTASVVPGLQHDKKGWPKQAVCAVLCSDKCRKSQLADSRRSGAGGQPKLGFSQWAGCYWLTTTGPVLPCTTPVCSPSLPLPCPQACLLIIIIII